MFRFGQYHPNWTSKRTLSLFLGALALSSLVNSFNLSRLEAMLYDFRMAFGIHSGVHSEIVLIEADDSSLKDLGELPPVSFGTQLKLLSKLAEAQPKAIGYLMDPSVSLQKSEDIGSSRPDSKSSQFVSIVSQMLSSGILFCIGTSFDNTGEVLPLFPISTLPHSIAVLHRDGFVFGEDKVVRRAMVKLFDRNTFHQELAEGIYPELKDHRYYGEFDEPAIKSKFVFFRYGLKKFQTYSLKHVLDQSFPLGALHDKIILFGTKFRTNPQDFVLTPLDHQPFHTPSLVAHAHILDSLIHKRTLNKSPIYFDWLITFLFSSLILWIVFTSTPLIGLYTSILLALGYWVVSQIAFTGIDYWIPAAYVLVTIVASYYLGVPYRLIQEYQRRWHFQRKHQLLQQVEEMKTNFLRLVTHDLKTPIARIQGLTELLRRRLQSQNPLTEQDQSSLFQIHSSADELNHFVSRLLELTRLDSGSVETRFESKDVNRIVEFTRDRFSPFAETKKITIKTELEPLFPIQTDEGLLKKVLSNLVDNAIKYSPENSFISITTREDQESVKIEVTDSGPGFSELDRTQMFSRFYRGASSLDQGIPGTGLGLYLSKFFIESLGGTLEYSPCDLIQNSGSKFIISLPISLPVSLKPGLTLSTQDKGDIHVSSSSS